jgi:hypothetical protein
MAYLELATVVVRVWSPAQVAAILNNHVIEPILVSWG